MRIASIEGFRHHTPVTIRFADLDALKHVNCARCQAYLEIARGRYYAGLDLWHGKPGGIAPIMARATMDYWLRLTWGCTITVYTRCCRLGTRSYDLEHLIVRHQNGAEGIAVRGLITAVMYDHENGHSIPIPPTWRQKIIDFEPVTPQS